MRTRNELYQSLLKQITLPTPQKSTLLFHHIFSLKLGDEFVLNTKEQFDGLVQFLNEQEA